MPTIFDCPAKTRLELDFEKFDKKNPHVWELFVKFAFQSINKGFSHYGAKTIFEAIRYHCDITTIGSEFKLNNNYTAYYARKFHKAFPLYGNFFETRTTNRKS